MEKYILFCGHNYYPDGGWQDFQGEFDSIEEAEASIAGVAFDWWHIVHKYQIVKHNKGKYD